MKVFNGLLLFAVLLFGSFKVDSNSVTPKKLNLIGTSDKVSITAHDSGKIDTILARDVSKFVGKTVRCVGIINDYKRNGNNILLYIGNNNTYRLLTVVLNESSQKDIDWLGARLMVSIIGKVEIVDHSLQIFVSDRKNLQVLMNQ